MNTKHELKTLNISLMCFDRKNNHFKKKKRKYSSSNKEKILKVLKIDFLLTDDEI